MGENENITPAFELFIEHKIEAKMTPINREMEQIKLSLNSLETGVGFLKWAIPIGMAMATFLGKML